ncbi:MAG: nuclear transport factor 2 family protein [Chloroflexi bacterium]|nr:nuclear transport factor 2 family protein [Chloroflexota bacterium]
MADHPNVTLLRRGYDAFDRGDMAALTEIFAEDAVWHLPGRHSVAGEHTGRNAIFAAMGQFAELSGGTLKLGIHDILASDEHTVVLSQGTAQRQGKQFNLRGVDIYHIRDGKIKEFWSFSEDQRLDDEFWS